MNPKQKSNQVETEKEGILGNNSSKLLYFTYKIDYFKFIYSDTEQVTSLKLNTRKYCPLHPTLSLI